MYSSKKFKFMGKRFLEQWETLWFNESYIKIRQGKIHLPRKQYRHEFMPSITMSTVLNALLCWWTCRKLGLYLSINLGIQLICIIEWKVKRGKECDECNMKVSDDSTS